jgi:hypothetical protein
LLCFKLAGCTNVHLQSIYTLKYKVNIDNLKN